MGTLLDAAKRFLDRKPRRRTTDDLTVKLDDAELNNLGLDLHRWIIAGIAEQGALPERWEQLEKDYSTQPTAGGVELIPGQPPRCFNITQSRVDQLVGGVCGPMTANQPYFVAKAYGQDESSVKMAENTVYYLQRVADFERRLRMATRMTCMAAPAIFRFMLRDEGDEDIDISLSGNEKVLPRLDVIHPKDFVIYPAAVHDIRRAVLVGQRLWFTLQEIQDLQESGDYLPGEIAPVGENPQDYEVGRRKDWSMTEETAGIVPPEHFLIQCYEVLFKGTLEDDTRKWYRAIIALQQKQVLLIERYPYSQPWYFEHFLDEEYGAFYRANPPAQKLQQIQSAVNDVTNLMIDGSIFSAFPAGFTNARMLKQDFMKYEAGTLNYIDGDPNSIHWTKCDFDPKVMPELIEKFEDWADSAIRISQAGMGQEFKSGTTATEASGILAGQQAGLDEYRANAAMSGVRLCDFIRELAFLHHDELQATFGEAYPCSDRGCLEKPLMWEAAGKTSENLPQTIINKLQMLMQFLMPLVQPLMQQGVSINLPELVKVYFDSLKLPVDTDKVLQKYMQSPQGQEMMNGNPAQLGNVLSQLGMGGNPNGPPPGNGPLPPSNGAPPGYP